MQRNISSLIGYSLGATDGEIGKVDEFYFDDKNWSIRYLIVETGSWLNGRKVLIAPQSVKSTDSDAKEFFVNLSKELIKTSPDIDTDKPVSSQQEISLYGHYAWDRYGGGGFYAGGSAPFLNTPLIIDEKVFKEADNNDDRKDDDLHLRSTNALTGYHIHATDGDIGHVNDFIIDDKTWEVLYFVIDTHNWFGGKKVLVNVKHITDIQWENSKIILDISMEGVKECEVFDESDYDHIEQTDSSSKQPRETSL